MSIFDNALCSFVASAAVIAPGAGAFSFALATASLYAATASLTVIGTMVGGSRDHRAGISVAAMSRRGTPPPAFSQLSYAAFLEWAASRYVRSALRRSATLTSGIIAPPPTFTQRGLATA